MSALVLLLCLALCGLGGAFLWGLYQELAGTRSEGALWSILSFSLLYGLLQWSAPAWMSAELMELIGLVWLILIPLLFAHELKRAFERLGNHLDPKRLFKRSSPLSQDVADAIYTALIDLAEHKTGALIVIKQRADLSAFLSDGVELNARVSAPLLLTIFSGQSSNPLHDGAVLIADNVIRYASTFLPMTRARDVQQHFGTRHRAALGLSEETDALVLLVSEERAWISMAYAGQMTENLSAEELKLTLDRFCSPEGYSLPTKLQ